MFTVTPPPLGAALFGAAARPALALNKAGEKALEDAEEAVR